MQDWEGSHIGFWGNLAKFGGLGASIAAIPFTGGASGSLLGALGLGKTAAAGIGALAPILGGIAGGRAQGRQTDIGAAALQDELRLRRAQMEQERQQGGFTNQILLNELAASRPELRARQALRGDILARAQDFKITGPIAGGRIRIPSSTGGLRPSEVFGPATREAGRTLAEIGRSNIGNEQLPTAPAFGALPQITQAGGSNLMDKLLGGAAGASGILGALYPRSTTEDPRKRQGPYQPLQGQFQGNPWATYRPPTFGGWG